MGSTVPAFRASIHHAMPCPFLYLQEQTAVAQQRHTQQAAPAQPAAQPQPADDADTDGWTFGPPAAAATPDIAAPASSTQSDSGSGSSGSDSYDGSKPIFHNVGRAAEADGGAQVAPAAAAAPAVPAISNGAAVVPGAEELSPEELAFLGYSAPVPRPTAAPQPAAAQPAARGGGVSDGSRSSSDSSESDDDDDEDLNRCSEDESDGGGMEMI